MLRNKEIRRFAVLFSLMAAAAIAIGFFIKPAAGFLAAGSAAAYGTAFFLFTKARYQGIARISSQIDRVLHNADRLDIGESAEGELSILYSEISKMTLRIREQNDALKKEKERLADSLADIAHQLRTPLTSVNLILPLLSENPDAHGREALAREAEGLLVRMDWLLTSLLQLARLDAGIVAFENGRVDVKALLDTACRPLLIPLELHQIALRMDVPEGIAVNGDFAWLSEALQNIIKNGLESAGDKGEIHIACTDNPLYTGITIRDSGPGFAKEDIPRLFDRFHRGKSANATGYGIGLALCKTIITRQGGTVCAKNHPQGGAVFTIRFPK